MAGRIKSEHLKDVLKLILDEYLPSYWFEVGASSTGKYHPNYASGEGGLMRHSKAAMRIGFDLLENPAIGGKYTAREKDLMLMSLLVHDGLKLGLPQEKYTRFDHPILMANYIKENQNDLELNNDEIKFVCDAIINHMGPWTKNYKGEEVLSPPETKYQRFVHMCDYLASRKFLDIKFDKDNNIK